MSLEIILWPHEILKTPCEEVKDVSEYTDFANAMMETMKATGHGLGMAANQVGKSIRLLVMDVRRPFIMFNPVIVKTSKGKMDSKEGCLSFPDLEIIMRRWKWISVEYIDEDGIFCRRKFRELEGRCLQHEINHLDGIVFTGE